MMKVIVAPIINEMAMKEERGTCSPKVKPIEMIASAQMNDAIRKMKLVIMVGVLASPANMGINALIDGVSFPKKSHQIPRLENVSDSAP